MDIVYEDNHILIVYKKRNVLTQKSKKSDYSLNDMVKDYIKNKYNKKGEVYLALINRLDRNVPGLVLFAKTSKAAKRLNKMMQEKKITRKYLAIIINNLKKDSDELIDYLEKDKKNNVVHVSKNGKKAILKYKVLKKIKKYALVEIEIITGRSHQIRVQFASRFSPIVGDQKYGIRNNEDIMLYAYKLDFVHPVSQKTINIELDIIDKIIKKYCK